MLIDWFTVGAQVVNFLVLIVLLKRFLYQPVLKAIDAREKRIADALADAATKQATADSKRSDLESKNTVFDAQKAELLSKATQEAKVELDRLLNEARKKADDLALVRARALEAEHASLVQQLSRLAGNEVFEVARKVFNDLATVSLEERIGEIFTRRLRELDGPMRKAIGEAIAASEEPAFVRTRFVLPLEQRAVIGNALNEAFSAAVRVEFQTSVDCVCGIELTVKGQKLAWSIGEYLRVLEQKANQLLDAQSKPAPQPPVVIRPPEIKSSMPLQGSTVTS